MTVGKQGFIQELSIALQVPPLSPCKGHNSLIGERGGAEKLATFGELWEWVQKHQAKAIWPLVPLSQARAELQQLVRQHEAAVG